MRTLLIAPFAALALLTACTAPNDTATANAEADIAWEAFGGPVSEAAPVTVEALLSAPEQYDGKTVVVEGTILQACPKKGCWMKFEAAGEELMVTFKDYGFFVPTDANGRVARFEGQFAITETSVADARHYLEDAGDFEAAAKITEPQKTFALVATGAKLQ